MKKILISSIVLALIVGLNAFKSGETYETLSIGSKAPDLISNSLMSSNDEMVSVKSLAKDNGTLVIFSCNTCPFVIAWEDRYPALKKLTEDNKVGFALINSNAAKRSGDDSKEMMKAHANEMGYGDITYLVDKSSLLANAFGAKTTPHVFLFDKNWKLVYEGAIDDNYKDAASVEQTYLNDAINNLVSGKKIDPNNTKAIGCSIKRGG